ncbi:anaphase-promoting complex subunit 5-like [Copidosoma floridanum]|nr:anaphase-promoting complex subunit 5-like [Copidosoma floridanum]
MPFQALRNVKDAMIHILAHGGLYDQARAYVTYAKVLSANTQNQTAETKKYMMMEAIKHLQKAKKILEKLEANDRLKSTLYLLSVFYNEIGMHDERNKCAFEFKQLDQQFPMDRNHVILF